MLLPLALRLGPRGLGFLEGLADGLRALLHLGEQRPVEEPPEHTEQQGEVDDLEAQRPVDVDEARLAFAREGRARRCNEQEESDGKNPAHGEISGGNPVL